MTALLPSLSVLSWILLAAAALVVGFSKTALPGASTLSIATFATILPAKASTGALLLLLIVGDVFALWSYRRHTDWPTILRLAPAVILGLVLGTVFLATADDTWVGKAIGGILLLLIAFTLWRRRVSHGEPSVRSGLIARIGYGSLSGFTTMVANAGGPAMSLYLLAANFSVKAFLGTAAWFFAIINIIKLPFSVGLGLITTTTLALDLLLVPGVIVGAFIGRWVATRIPQELFHRAVLAITVLGALYLLLS